MVCWENGCSDAGLARDQLVYISFTDISYFLSPLRARPFSYWVLVSVCFLILRLVFSSIRKVSFFSALVITAVYEYSGMKRSVFFLWVIALLSSSINLSLTDSTLLLFGVQGSQMLLSFSPVSAFIFARFLFLLLFARTGSLSLVSGGSFVVLFTSRGFFLFFVFLFVSILFRSFFFFVYSCSHAPPFSEVYQLYLQVLVFIPAPEESGRRLYLGVSLARRSVWSW